MEKNRYGHILTENFQEAVGAWIKNYSNNIAIIEGERKITYRELGNLIIRCRKFFFEQGVKKGDNIAVHMGNHSEFIMVFLSLVTMGAVPILILSAQKKNEVRGIVRVATPKLYIYDAAVSVLGSLVAEGNKELKGIEKTIFTSMLESSEVEKTKEETYKEQIVPEDLALLLLSGGTTGIPKLIPRTHGDYLYNVKRITERLKLTQESVFLSVLPMAHNFALGNPGILGTLCSGGTVVICNDIAAMEIFSLIEETKVTFTAFVPSILKMCLEYRILDDGDDISSLQQVLVGGAMLPEETARQVDLVLGGKLIQVFGTAEGLICTNSMDDSYETRVSCQGQPISEYDEIKIIDSDGKEVAQGEIGELIVKGPYTIQEYYRLLDNDKYFNEEGFYLSGDKVRKLEDGNLKVVGRVKEQINRAGEKIMPKGSIEELVKTKYISINRKMDKKVLDRLTLKLKISTEEILLIVFSYTVLKYTKKEQVLINFPFSNRTKERQNRVGDYTKSIIYRCDIKRGVAFNEFCKAMHKKYKEDIKHVDLDGVSVQRILKNHCQGNEKYPVPLVFSPSFEIPMLSEVFLNEIGDLSYIISQTPGVWLDAQVYQLKQDFFFSWVILEGILDETELSEMMDLYIKILTEIDKSEGGNLDE